MNENKYKLYKNKRYVDYIHKFIRYLCLQTNKEKFKIECSDGNIGGSSFQFDSIENDITVCCR